MTQTLPKAPRLSRWVGRLSAFEAALWVGWATALVFLTVGSSLTEDLSNPAKFALLFAWLFAAMLWLAFRAVRHAEELAHVLGEPLGTIVLSLAVICIEVALVVTVTLAGSGSPTLARDTMFAVLMVVLNGMTGLTLVVGGLRHHEQVYNLRGANAYVGVLMPLAVLGLIVPRFTPSAPGGQVSVTTAIFLAVMSAGLYVVFLLIQTGRHTADFQEPAEPGEDAERRIDAAHAPVPHRSAFVHAALLVAALLPIVLMCKKFAVLVDYGVKRLHAPAALGGLLVAILVLAPEGLAAFQAALANRLQRTVNLLFGAALSTIGLTIPAILLVRLFAQIPIELGLEPVQAILLGLTLASCVVSFGRGRTTVLQGAVHLVLFVAYLMLIFD